MSVIGRHEIFVGSFGGFGGGDGRRDQDAVAEGSAGIGGQREIQLLLAIAENLLAERVGGEKAVAAGVPVCGKAGIGRVIQDGDGDGLVGDETAEIDRKSTRLNSSHLVISYAVFCLKKKNLPCGGTIY